MKDFNSNPIPSEIRSFINFLLRAKCPSDKSFDNFYSGRTKASLIRKQNLILYLNHMLSLSPKYLLVGEAPGYKGCKLTGIPFSSEHVVATHPFFRGKGYRLLSDTCSKENTATIIWNELDKYNDKPLLWNIFPFHPFNDSPATNRAPNAVETSFGLIVIKKLLSIFDIQHIVSVGQKATKKLDTAFDVIPLRHPSYGGKSEFSKGLSQILN